jgi:hypothetical protein
MFSRGKTPTRKIHDPSQRDHLENFINEKEKYYKEILQEIFSQSIIRK